MIAWGKLVVQTLLSVERDHHTNKALARLVWISSSVLRSSTLTICCCMGIVFSIRCKIMSDNLATMGRLSLAALVTKVFKTS